VGLVSYVHRDAAGAYRFHRGIPEALRPFVPASRPTDEAHIWHVASAITSFDIDGGALVFRHTSGQTGAPSAEDDLAGRMRLVDERSGEISAHGSIEAFVRDGWPPRDDVTPPPGRQ
jgi:hypothetical protein